MSLEETKLVDGDPGSPPTRYHKVGAVDRAMAVMDAKAPVGFEATVELDGTIDADALTEAWSRLVGRHPILSCIRAGDTWQPAASPPMGADVEQPRHEDPPVALRVGPTESGVRLTLLCNHVAFDGMASVVLLGDLRVAYTRVIEGREPLEIDWSERTLEAAARQELHWRATAAAALRGATTWWQTPVSTHVAPGPATQAPATGYRLMEFGPVLAAMTPHRSRHDWSTDAVIVGVLEMAWSSVFGAPTADSSWMVARDLRPALGMNRGIGNLSVIAGVSISPGGSDVKTIIDRVDARMKAQSRDLVTAAAALPRRRPASDVVFAQMLRRSDKSRHHRSASNVGQLGRSLDSWGEAALGRIWFLGPLANAPYTSFIAAGHGSSTLVSVRTSPHWLTPEHADALEQAALELA